MSKQRLGSIGLAIGALVLAVLAGAILSRGTTSLQAAGGPCQFQKADAPTNVALCETFDAPAGNGGRSGDLDPGLWGVSRIGVSDSNITQGGLNGYYPATLLGCGAPQKVVPPHDVRVCNGRLVEAAEDNESQVVLAMYPKQPFDINGGRTGTVVFDVSADSGGPHSAWPEFWWTDQPVPAPTGEIASVETYARNSFGFTLDGCEGNLTGVGSMQLTRNYQHSHMDFDQRGCVTKGSPTGALNHFEVRISQSKVEVWGTDPGSSNLKLLAVAENANLPLTRGLIWLNHTTYNACKFGNPPQCDHSYAWDNVGFDGPTPYRDLSFDVPDRLTPSHSGSVKLGYRTGELLKIPGVYWDQTPTGAIVTFNWFPWEPHVPDVRVNGGPWHSTAWPGSSTFNWRTIAVSIPVSEVKAGENTVEFRSGDETLLANINIILIAGAPVPGGGGTPSQATGTAPIQLTVTPTPTASPKATATATSTATATATSTVAPTPTATPTSTPKVTATPSATATPKATATPSATVTATPAATVTPTAAPTDALLLGRIPRDGFALLLVRRDSTLTEVLAALDAEGCSSPVVAMHASKNWFVYIGAAPQRVNRDFPSTVPANAVLFVRC